jgi:hypothetical protein
MNGDLYAVKKVLIFVFSLVLASGTITGMGQIAKSQLRAEPLESYLRKLEQKHNISFVYDASEINRSASVEASQEASSLESSLNSLIAIGISYKIVGDKVILQKKKVLAPAEYVVTGDVIEIVKGEPMPMVGVSIRCIHS